MFEKFGEMNSMEEINELAANLLKEGDTDSIRIMAKENGIPADYADMFIEGAFPYMVDSPFTAASGKLDVEAEDLKATGLIADWVEYIRGVCMENQYMAEKVREKGKSLKACIAKLLKYSFSNRQQLDKKICEMAGIKNARVEFGIPGMKDAKRIIREYYDGGGR
jgi:hypothetical protein